MTDERSVCSAVIVSGLISGGITTLGVDVLVNHGARLASQPFDQGMKEQSLSERLRAA